MEYDCPLRSQKWLVNIGYNLDDMRNLVEKSNNYFFLPVLGLNERADELRINFWIRFFTFGNMGTIVKIIINKLMSMQAFDYSA